MADRTIGDLPAASQLLTADLIPIEQGGNAKSISGQILANYAREKAQQAAGGYAANAAQSAADAAASAAEAAAWSEHPPYIGANGNWWVWNTTTNQYVDSLVDASITVDIEDITMLATDASPYVTNTGTSTDPIFHLFVPAPNAITTIAKTSTSGLTDTYTITYSNGQNSTFQVVNGEDGYNPVVTISTITGGHRVVITDKDHPSGQSFDIMDGVDGDDGYNPTVTITSITGGHTVTITDVDHQSGQSFNVMDGTDGQDGVSPEVTIATVTGGHSVTITDADHPSGQTFTVLDGSGSGDMQSSTYDPTDSVATAGGIPSYVAAQHDDTKTNLTDIATVEATSTASAAHAVGSYLILDGALYRVTTAIAVGDTITDTGAGANVTAVTVGSELGGNNPYIAMVAAANAVANGGGLQGNMGFVEDITYAGCFYRMVGTVKEWQNPPLTTVGEWYRTTERENGTEVYKMRDTNGLVWRRVGTDGVICSDFIGQRIDLNSCSTITAVAQKMGLASNKNIYGIYGYGSVGAQQSSNLKTLIGQPSGSNYTSVEIHCIQAVIASGLTCVLEAIAANTTASAGSIYRKYLWLNSGVESQSEWETITRQS